MANEAFKVWLPGLGETRSTAKGMFAKSARDAALRRVRKVSYVGIVEVLAGYSLSAGGHVKSRFSASILGGEPILHEVW